MIGGRPVPRKVIRNHALRGVYRKEFKALRLLARSSGPDYAEFPTGQKIVKDWVKPPTNQPWGTRSIYFRDPDGNLVDFYAWVKKKPG